MNHFSRFSRQSFWLSKSMQVAAKDSDARAFQFHFIQAMPAYFVARRGHGKRINRALYLCYLAQVSLYNTYVSSLGRCPSPCQRHVTAKASPDASELSCQPARLAYCIFFFVSSISLLFRSVVPFPKRSFSCTHSLSFHTLLL